MRILAIQKIDISKSNANNTIKKIEDIAVNDKKTLVQAEAISKLAIIEDEKYIPLFNKGQQSKSNAVKGNSLQALLKLDKEEALKFANSIDNEIDKASLKYALIPVYIKNKTEEEMPFVARDLVEGMFFEIPGVDNNTYKEGFQWILLTDNEEATQNLIDNLVEVGTNYQDIGADKLASQVLQLVLQAKKESNYTNKDELIKIVQEGLNKLQ